MCGAVFGLGFCARICGNFRAPTSLAMASTSGSKDAEALTVSGSMTTLGTTGEQVVNPPVLCSSSGLVKSSVDLIMTAVGFSHMGGLPHMDGLPHLGWPTHVDGLSRTPTVPPGSVAGVLVDPYVGRSHLVSTVGPLFMWALRTCIPH